MSARLVVSYPWACAEEFRTVGCDAPYTFEDGVREKPRSLVLIWPAHRGTDDADGIAVDETTCVRGED